jgi:hypothetical protein
VGFFLFGCGFLGLFFLFCFFSFGGVDGTTHVYLGDVIVNVDVCVAGVRLVAHSRWPRWAPDSRPWATYDWRSTRSAPLTSDSSPPGFISGRRRCMLEVML